MPITNEVLAEKLDGLNSRVSDLQATTREFGSTFVRSEVFDLRFRELDLAISNIALGQTNAKSEIEKLKSRRIVPTVVTAFIASIVTAAFTYLLYARIQG